jgi:GLPGLI family protein
MRLIIWICIVFLSLGTVFAQKMEGEITYEKAVIWKRVTAGLSYLSQEERDRINLTYSDWKYRRKMLLTFNESKSMYTYAPDQEGFSDLKICRDFEKQRRSDLIHTLGKLYVVEDSISAPKWKVMNKIKEVAGYMCMMAVTEDTIKHQKITAWFADNLPVSVGPEFYMGLPGAILELEVNDGDAVITAVKVELKPVTTSMELPKKQKGKKISATEYSALINDHMKTSIKMQRNPYYAMDF